MSLSQTTLDSTTTSELSAKSAKGIETSVFVVTGSDSQDITPSRPIGVRSNIDDIFPLTLENEYVDRNKDSKPEVTFVLAVEVSSVLKGRMVGALGLNKNNRSDCDSSEVIANEEVTYSFSKVKGKMSSIFERTPIGLEGVIS
jgi:hypothetical protein